MEKACQAFATMYNPASCKLYIEGSRGKRFKTTYIAEAF